MAIKNDAIVAAFNELADKIEMEGDNPFKARAYRRAARVIEKLDKELFELCAEGFNLTELPSIGEKIAAIIKSIIETQELPVFKNPVDHLNSSLNDLIKIKGMSAEHIKVLNKNHIKTKEDLLKAIAREEIQKLPQFNAQLEGRLRWALKKIPTKERYFRYFHVAPAVNSLLLKINEWLFVHEAQCAGLFRRRGEVISEVELVVAAQDKQAVVEEFLKLSLVKEVISRKANGVSAYLGMGLIINLNVVKPESYATTLLYQTGSRTHVEHLKRVAARKNLSFTASGIFKNKKQILVASEAELYDQLGLQNIPAELRENRGEIEAAQQGLLPRLIELEDMKGDLHAHTNQSDGRDPLEVMVEAAKAKGYEYIAITDHSQSLKITNGLNEERLWQQIKRIDQLNEKLDGIVVLKASEVDILQDGSLDYSDKILQHLDVTVCSVHSYFKLPSKKQTERIIRAMDNPYFKILGHATGRLIRRREPYEVDVEKILAAAKERGCFIEINAQPYRLDINDIYCQMAKGLGVKLAISSDAHNHKDLDYMKFGVYQARRGWLEAADIINTRNLRQLKRLLKRV
jgi:DNA polymerase (family X)